MDISITNHDGSAPAPPDRRSYTGDEHASVTAFRATSDAGRAALVRLVDTGHMDADVQAHLDAIAASTAALHAQLDAADAAWAANYVTESEG